jgi:hypothetical protein
MKKNLLFILFALISTLGFSQQTYMPDDYLENYFETNSGVSFNNDNYVSTTILANFSTIVVNTPNTIDFTGIQDVGTTSGIWMISLICSNTIIDLSALPNLINHPLNNSVGGVSLGLNIIVAAPFLTQLILPPNRIQLSISEHNPYLSNITFQNSNILSSITISGGNGIVFMPSLICLDLSNISDVIPGSFLNINGSNLAVLKLNNGKCNKWGTVLLTTAVGACISVDNPAFCYTAVSVGSWYNFQGVGVVVPGTFSTNCSNCISNLDEIQNKINYSISPNPTTSKITVKSSLELIGKEFTIYDQLGKEVMSGLITSEDTEIDLSNISEGVYLFIVGRDMQETFKIIKH